MSFIEWKEKIRDIPEELAPFLIQIFTVLKVLCMSFSQDLTSGVYILIKYN